MAQALTISGNLYSLNVVETRVQFTWTERYTIHNSALNFSLSHALVMSENKGFTGVLASYASFKHQLKYCFTCVPLCDKYYMYL